MYIGQKVLDMVDDSEGNGIIIDIYMNYHNFNPTTMFVVDFGDDRVFDRLEHEIEEA